MTSVIADFLEMGHVENILALFRQEKEHYQLCGALVSDERFMVRMGMAVLFEELVAAGEQENLELAIPSLAAKLRDGRDYVRGEAATLLGIIGTEKARRHLIPLLEDGSSQVVEIVRDVLQQEPCSQ